MTMRPTTDSMMRYWIGTALLAGSWLFGLEYFTPANPYAWLAAVVVAVLLFGKPRSLPASSSPWQLSAIAIVLLLPAICFAQGPYRAVLLLIAIGAALRLTPIHRLRWVQGLATGAMMAGMVLLVQAIVLEIYSAYTAHSHNLPWPLPDAIAAVVGLFGVDATADGSSVTIFSMRQVHRLAATWELLLDPATLLFFIGGLTMLACRVCDAVCEPCRDSCDAVPQGKKQKADETPLPEKTLCKTWCADAAWLLLIVAAWLPLRTAILVAIYIHRVLRSDPTRPLHAMNHFFSPWMLLVLLVVPVLLAWRFVRNTSKLTADASPELTPETRPPFPVHPSSFSIHHSLRLVVSSLLIALSVALFTAAIFWSPVGARNKGRVMVVERHSRWEPTTKPYDTQWYVEPEPFPDVNSGYNYARAYRYLGQYYDMSRLLESGQINDDTLAKCDVLVVKTPTERYSPDEVKAVIKFVEQGGGLLLIGDHTNYAKSTTVMNDLIRPMGFIFRDDLLFSFGESPFEQHYVPPPVPHPAVQHMPPMDFAVSCSVDPGHSSGRPVIENTGLWSMGPEYHYENYLPFPQHNPAMRYGAFVQTWAATYGQGRAIAFADSTIFSNFAVGQPGKSELLLGMVEWLNHRNPWLDPRPWLLLLGLVPLAAGVWLAAKASCAEWLVLFAAGTCGWALASLAVVGLQRWQMPLPNCQRPERCVVIDRTTSDVPLSKGAFTQGNGAGYGLFEQWLARLDCRTVRQQGDESFSGDALVVICPSRSVPDNFREAAQQYVANGGKLLVIDAPENTRSTANGLLASFGITVRHDRFTKGELNASIKLPRVDVDGACLVTGGQTIATIANYPVAAVASHGKGTVVVIGFGSLWNDTRMGDHWMNEPDATIKARFDTLFGLVRPLLDGKPWPAPKSPAAPEKDNGPKEAGPAEL